MKTFLTQFFILSILTAGIDFLLSDSRYRAHARFACQLITLFFLSGHLIGAYRYLQTLLGG